MDAHNILNIGKQSSSKEIKAAFRKLALKHHPDSGGEEEDFIKIHAAYKHLVENRETAEKHAMSLNDIIDWMENNDGVKTSDGVKYEKYGKHLRIVNILKAGQFHFDGNIDVEFIDSTNIEFQTNIRCINLTASKVNGAKITAKNANIQYVEGNCVIEIQNAIYVHSFNDGKITGNQVDIHDAENATISGNEVILRGHFHNSKIHLGRLLKIGERAKFTGRVVVTWGDNKALNATEIQSFINKYDKDIINIQLLEFILRRNLMLNLPKMLINKVKMSNFWKKSWTNEQIDIFKNMFGR